MTPKPLKIEKIVKYLKENGWGYTIFKEDGKNYLHYTSESFGVTPSAKLKIDED